MDFSFSDFNFNSVVIDDVVMLPSIENLPGFEACAAFLCKCKALRINPVNSASVFCEDEDIAPTIVDDMLLRLLTGISSIALSFTRRSYFSRSSLYLSNFQ